MRLVGQNRQTAKVAGLTQPRAQHFRLRFAYGIRGLKKEHQHGNSNGPTGVCRDAPLGRLLEGARRLHALREWYRTTAAATPQARATMLRENGSPATARAVRC